jgi:NUMOD4 motif./HNH endonuclease.
MYKRKKGQSISRAKKYTYEGVEYKSSLEVYMATILREEGIYFGYEKVSFILQESFDSGSEYWERQSNGKGEYKIRSSSVRPITYVPDFVGEGFIIETKGWANESFPIKYKMFKNLVKNLDYVLYKPQNQKECDDTLIDILKKEVWIEVKDFVGYEVSNYGRVRTIEKLTECTRDRKGLVKEKILQQTTNSNGYKVLHLYKDNVKTFCQVHRLVLLSFFSDSEEETVNHIDEIKSNNCLSNLEWMTKSDNIRYSKNKAVLKLGIEGYVLKEYSSLQETLKDGFNPKSVSMCCKGKYNTAGGFKWKFKE